MEEELSWLDDFLEGKIEKGEVAYLTPLDDSDADDAADDDYYEAAYLKDDPISKDERLIREKSLKKPMINIIDESETTPLLVSNQEGRLEIGGSSSSAFKYSSSSSSDSSAKKKRSFNHIASSSDSDSDSDSDSLTKQERLKREKLLKAPATSPDQPKKSSNKTNRGPPKTPPPPVLPDQFRNMITELGGTDIRLVIQKQLTETDCYRRRSSMPLGQIEDKNLFTDEEKANLANKIPIVVELVVDTKCSSKCDGMTTLRRWDMKKQSGASNPIYVLTTKWNDLVFSNRLKPGDIVQVWSFRVGFKLHLAIVRVEKGETDDDEEEEEEDDNDVGIASSSAANQSTKDEAKEQE